MINVDWHTKHKMPSNPTLDQRVTWHLAHVRHCNCRRLHGTILLEFKKRYLGTHQEFWIYFDKNDHQAIAIWAKACASHVLKLFQDNFPQDPRPQTALHTLQDWLDTGKFNLKIIRHASLAAHAAARNVIKQNPAAAHTARATGHAVATVHVPTHAFGTVSYALKAIDAAHPQTHEATAKEYDWQIKQLPPNLKPWVITQLHKSPRLLPQALHLSQTSVTNHH